MGQDWQPDEAVSPRLIKALLRRLEDNVASAEDAEQASQWVTARALFVFLYVFSLRGNEGMLADLQGIRDK
jgi:CheY-like chemotaxis protein